MTARILRFSLKSAVGNFWKKASSIYDFTVDDIDGNPVSLDKYRLVDAFYLETAAELPITK